jgi:hypothetical protein
MIASWRTLVLLLLCTSVTCFQLPFKPLKISQSLNRKNGIAAVKKTVRQLQPPLKLFFDDNQDGFGSLFNSLLKPGAEIYLNDQQVKLVLLKKLSSHSWLVEIFKFDGSKYSSLGTKECDENTIIQRFSFPRDAFKMPMGGLGGGSSLLESLLGSSLPSSSSSTNPFVDNQQRKGRSNFERPTPQSLKSFLSRDRERKSNDFEKLLDEMIKGLFGFSPSSPEKNNNRRRGGPNPFSDDSGTEDTDINKNKNKDNFFSRILDLFQQGTKDSGSESSEKKDNNSNKQQKTNKKTASATPPKPILERIADHKTEQEIEAKEVSKLIVQGMDCERDGSAANLWDAVDAYNRVLRLDESNEIALTGLVRVCSQLGAEELVEKYSKQLQENQEKRLLHYCEAADHLCESGLKEGALDLLKTVLRRDANYPLAHELFAKWFEPEGGEPQSESEGGEGEGEELNSLYDDKEGGDEDEEERSEGRRIPISSSSKRGKEEKATGRKSKTIKKDVESLSSLLDEILKRRLGEEELKGKLGEKKKKEINQLVRDVLSEEEEETEGKEGGKKKEKDVRAQFNTVLDRLEKILANFTSSSTPPSIGSVPQKEEEETTSLSDFMKEGKKKKDDKDGGDDKDNNNNNNNSNSNNNQQGGGGNGPVSSSSSNSRGEKTTASSSSSSAKDEDEEVERKRLLEDHWQSLRGRRKDDPSFVDLMSSSSSSSSSGSDSPKKSMEDFLKDIFDSANREANRKVFGDRYEEMKNEELSSSSSSSFPRPDPGSGKATSFFEDMQKEILNEFHRKGQEHDNKEQRFVLSS